MGASRRSKVAQPSNSLFRPIAPVPRVQDAQAPSPPLEVSTPPCLPYATPGSGSSGTSSQHSGAWSNPVSPSDQYSGSPSSAYTDFQGTAPQSIFAPARWCQDPATYGYVAPSVPVTVVRSTGTQSIPTPPSEFRPPGPTLPPRHHSGDQAARYQQQQQQQQLEAQATRLEVQSQAFERAGTGRSDRNDAISSNSERPCELCEDPGCIYKSAGKHTPEGRARVLRLHRLHKMRRSKPGIRCDEDGCTQMIANGRKDNLENHKNSKNCAGFWRRQAGGEPAAGAVVQDAEQLTAKAELRRVEAELEAWLKDVLTAIEGQDGAASSQVFPPCPTDDLMVMMDFDHLEQGHHFEDSYHFDEAFWANGEQTPANEDVTDGAEFFG
ncbi:hypothetical protein B0H67DRAFT_558111 [Lasiosphaeris hirsuta]|uniref:Uncharacterized protein n=1 Tax=Lasiosphaeris hirsuta TaxID=260670 RepID=A0AA39ZXM3_9PEZI|nr:hypothetical protein B0H67DRAFT_558111 [Lasiosphaeris hirsuta]